MWDTDVCTNLIEGTPWIKHFAKHSQIGSVHLVMKSLPAPWHFGEVAWGWEQEGLGERPRTRGRQEVLNQGGGKGTRSLGELPEDPPPAGTHPVKEQNLGGGGAGDKVGSICLHRQAPAYL